MEEPLEPRSKHVTEKTALDHAWSWFALHATQRLQAVNFFLLSAAFLSAAFVAAAKENMHALAIGVALLAIIVSFLFYRVERRIRTLINAAESAMAPLQRNLASELSIEALSVIDAVERPKAGEWKYSKVFRYLYLTTGAAFGLGLLHQTWSASTTTSPTLAFNTIIELLVFAVLLSYGYEILVSVPATATAATRDNSTAHWVLLLLGSVSVLLALAVAAHLVIFRLL